MRIFVFGVCALVSGVLGWVLFFTAVTGNWIAAAGLAFGVTVSCTAALIVDALSDRWWVDPPVAVRSPSVATVVAPPVPAKTPDPGKQALAILQRGENCNWYSIEHDDGQMHEAFDCLEIYWRTEVECPEKNEFGWGRGPFESKAGFRVRWYVSATRCSHVESCGLDLMTTIMEARELADKHIVRNELAAEMEHRHPALETWKSKGPDRKYDFDGLDLEKWRVSLEYPGGCAWGEHTELDVAVAETLAKAPA